MNYIENIYICIAAPLIVSILCLRGRRRRSMLFFLGGMTACLAASYISTFLAMLHGADMTMASIEISPMVEEILKLAPVLFYILVLEPEKEEIMGTMLMVSVGFATFENCCYILTAGAGSLPYILVRGLAVGVMHIVSILALSIWLIVAKRLKAFSFPAVVGGLSLAMIFHALYNLLVSQPGVSTVIGYLMPLLTAAAFWLLYRKLPQIFEA